MNQRAFVSHAQNGEDVVLWRALRNVPLGRYVEVGANHPEHDSTTRAFYDMGWRGVLIEPMPDFATLLRQQRPGDIVVEAAITESTSPTVTLHAIPNSGLSTLRDDISQRHAGSGHASQNIEVRAARLDEVLSEHLEAGEPIHFMTIDVEGAEAEVLATLDLGRWAPWIVIVESTAPLSTQQTHDTWRALLTDHGYVECLFDGLSRYYCAPDHLSDLQQLLSYPACVLDGWETASETRLRVERDEAREEMLYWRGVALSNWSSAITAATQESSDEVRTRYAQAVDDLQQQIDALLASTSWRVTRPVRALKAAASRYRGAP